MLKNIHILVVDITPPPPPTISSGPPSRCAQSRVGVDAVRTGPVPDRALLWTGRGRSGSDRTEVAGGSYFQDRTGCSKARSRPRGPTGPTEFVSWECAGRIFGSV